MLYAVGVGCTFPTVVIIRLSQPSLASWLGLSLAKIIGLLPHQNKIKNQAKLEFDTEDQVLSDVCSELKV